MSSLKELVAELRRVYEPPTARAWSLVDVKIAKLLKAIDEMPEPIDRNAILDEVVSELEAVFLIDEDVAAIDVVRALKR